MSNKSLLLELVASPFASCAARKLKTDEGEERTEQHEELLPEHPIEHM